jgi:UDP-glucose 4-epimerase
MNILITGGAGYIGSHTALELLAQGHEVIIADNFSGSGSAVVERLKEISGKEITVYKGDLCDREFVTSIFSQHTIDAVIHFAGLKAVGESVERPLDYYRNNLDSTLTLCEVMKDSGVRKLIFSSSASVYGDAEELPVRETSRVGTGILSPYGRTKYMIELILQDLAASDKSWAITILRYFNPIGADKSGLIGEDPNGVPSNIFPYISQVAVGKLDHVNVFGGDYDTVDGTGVRDYIHVADLATGHVAALNHLQPKKEASVYNLGTGKGVSVLEMIHAFEKACGKRIPYEITGRRAGDPSASYSDPSKAAQELGWRATRTLEEACADSWKWQLANPNGYSEA